MSKKQSAPTPQRTREHVIADLSINFVERYFLEQGHVVNRDWKDYGYDLSIVTFNEHGHAEGGLIYLQLKATDAVERFELVQQEVFAVSIERKHCVLWSAEPMPVFFVLYDALKRKAYWLHTQDYFRSHPPPQPGSKSVTLHIPKKNVFGKRTIQKLRQQKAAVLKLAEETHHA